VREYEIMVVTKPDIPETEITKTVERWENIMKTGGGEILKKDLWGAKRLAYPIQKFNRGVYHVYNVATSSDNVKELDRVLGIDEGVLRKVSLQISENCAIEARKADLAKQDFSPKSKDFERSPRPGGRPGGRSDRGEGFERDGEDRFSGERQPRFGRQTEGGGDFGRDGNSDDN
jgi:small subunit ribosomal protein S6